MITCNSLPNDKNLDWFRFKAFADDKINVTEKKEIWFGKGGKHCGKKEKMLVTSIFSFDRNVFKSFLFQGRNCVVRVKITIVANSKPRGV